MEQRLLTVGHSTHSIEYFVGLLMQHGITALCDVRSTPYSRINPQFGRDALGPVLLRHGIAYVFMGKELGARTEDPFCYENGRVQYERLAETLEFRNGIRRILEGIRTHKIALMCAEKEPLDCHRTILVARHLVAQGADIHHLHADGRTESHSEALNRLLRRFSLLQTDMFLSREDLISEAYKRQEARIAFSIPSPTSLQNGSVRNQTR